MLLWILLVGLSIWAVIATVRAVRVDGLRPLRPASMVRPAEPRR